MRSVPSRDPPLEGLDGVGAEWLVVLCMWGGGVLGLTLVCYIVIICRTLVLAALEGKGEG